MRVFDCRCEWRFIIGGNSVYGPIYRQDWGGNHAEYHDCWSRGRLMSAEEFYDQYADCAYNAAMTNPDNQDDHERPWTELGYT